MITTRTSSPEPVVGSVDRQLQQAEGQRQQVGYHRVQPSVDPRARGRWTDRAACVDEDAELFFSSGRSVDARMEMELATTICGSCTVRLPCLLLAISTQAD